MPVSLLEQITFETLPSALNGETKFRLRLRSGRRRCAFPPPEQITQFHCKFALEHFAFENIQILFRQRYQFTFIMPRNHKTWTTRFAGVRCAPAEQFQNEIALKIVARRGHAHPGRGR
jgi:hypothetical protein